MSAAQIVEIIIFQVQMELFNVNGPEIIAQMVVERVFLNKKDLK